MATDTLEPSASALGSYRWGEALVGLYLLANYRYASENGPPGGDFFRYQNILGGLTAGTTRRIALRMARRTTCVVPDCGKELRPGSTGDHIIAQALGGPQGLENYLPLCAPHNSSKGTRDLLVWWRRIERPASELPADALIAYTRLMYVWLNGRDQLRAPAPEAVCEVVNELSRLLPSQEHQRLWWLRVAHMTGRS